MGACVLFHPGSSLSDVESPRLPFLNHSSVSNRSSVRCSRVAVCVLALPLLFIIASQLSTFGVLTQPLLLASQGTNSTSSTNGSAVPRWLNWIFVLLFGGSGLCYRLIARGVLVALHSSLRSSFNRLKAHWSTDQCSQHLVKKSVPELQAYLDAQMVQDEFRDTPHQIGEQVAEVTVEKAKEIVSTILPLFFGFVGNGKSSVLNWLFASHGDNSWPAPIDEDNDCTEEVKIYECANHCTSIAGQNVKLLAADTPGWQYGKEPGPIVQLCKEQVKEQRLVPEVFYSSLIMVLVVNSSVSSAKKNLNGDKAHEVLRKTCEAFRQEQLSTGVNANIILLLVVTHMDTLDNAAMVEELDVKQHRARNLDAVKKGFQKSVPEYVDLEGPILLCTRKGAKETNIEQLRDRINELFLRQVQSLEVRLVLFKSVESQMFQFVRAQLAQYDGVMSESSVARRVVWAMARLHGFQVNDLVKLIPGMRWRDAQRMCDVMQELLEQDRPTAARVSRCYTLSRIIKKFACCCATHRSTLAMYPSLQDPHIDALREDWDWKRRQSQQMSPLAIKPVSSTSFASSVTSASTAVACVACNA